MQHDLAGFGVGIADRRRNGQSLPHHLIPDRRDHKGRVRGLQIYLSVAGDVNGICLEHVALQSFYAHALPAQTLLGIFLRGHVHGICLGLHRASGFVADGGHDDLQPQVYAVIKHLHRAGGLIRAVVDLPHHIPVCALVLFVGSGLLQKAVGVIIPDGVKLGIVVVKRVYLYAMPVGKICKILHLGIVYGVFQGILAVPETGLGLLLLVKIGEGGAIILYAVLLVGGPEPHAGPVKSPVLAHDPVGDAALGVVFPQHPFIFVEKELTIGRVDAFHDSAAEKPSAVFHTEVVGPEAALVGIVKIKYAVLEVHYAHAAGDVFNKALIKAEVFGLLLQPYSTCNVPAGAVKPDDLPAVVVKRALPGLRPVLGAVNVGQTLGDAADGYAGSQQLPVVGNIFFRQDLRKNFRVGLAGQRIGRRQPHQLRNRVGGRPVNKLRILYEHIIAAAQKGGFQRLGKKTIRAGDRIVAHFSPSLNLQRKI